jgi:hypothetical protein
VRFKSAIAELKRRKVFRVGSIYLVLAWGASTGAAELFPAFGVPDWGVRAFVIAAFLGFPLAVALAWAYEITPEGVVRDLGDEDEEVVLDPASSETTAIDGTTVSEYQRVRVSWQADGRARVADFRQPFIIGRDSDADVRLMHNKISRHHARVHFEGGQWWIADLNSRNGTYLDGARLTEPAPLGSNSEVALFKGGPPIVISACHEGIETVLDG